MYTNHLYKPYGAVQRRSRTEWTASPCLFWAHLLLRLLTGRHQKGSRPGGTDGRTDGRTHFAHVALGCNQHIQSPPGTQFWGSQPGFWSLSFSQFFPWHRSLLPVYLNTRDRDHVRCHIDSFIICKVIQNWRTNLSCSSIKLPPQTPKQTMSRLL